MIIDYDYEGEINRLFELQTKNVVRLRTSSINDRIMKLKKLKEYIWENKEKIQEVVYRDLKKPSEEVLLTEIYPVISEIKYVIKNLKKWTRLQKMTTPISLFGAKSYYRFESKGVVLIISPWNYPFQLSIGPLITAIAAGNAVILKPSELSLNTSGYLKKLAVDVFDESEVAVIEGDAIVAQKLLENSFNHIFFTGSTKIAKSVLQKASSSLSSITLELGGKSPVIIDDKFDINEAAKKITWGKYLNAGQTCIAPDYVFVKKDLIGDFVNYLKHYIKKYYYSDGSERCTSYCSIINKQHFNRLKSVFDITVKEGAKVCEGGQFIEEECYISPTVLTDMGIDSHIMEEEIFGPILPVLPYEDINDVIRYINSKPTPLVLYVFSRDRKFYTNIVNHVISGDCLINDVIAHYANHKLPFGGHNASGIGKSHGFYGFKEFSHLRSIMIQPKYTMIQLLYPPYNDFIKKLIIWSTKYF